MKILKPLSVPWMVDPSLPKLTLISEEHGNHLVKFRGFFGFEGGADMPSDSVTVDSGALLVSPNEKSARYQLISLNFDVVGWMRRNPQYSDREVIRESDYDWSYVSGYFRSDESVEDNLKRFQQEWIDAKICPNPGVYVVENSDWDVGPERERFDLKHFLILGESCFIEILAKNCKWVSEGNIAP